MTKNLRRGSAAALVLLLSAISGTDEAFAQVPAPPMLPGQASIAEDLKSALESNNLDKYAALLSDDLKVYEDDKMAASSKGEWLSVFGKKLVAEGVQFRVISEYGSTGRILFLEYFNSVASWGKTPPPDCCWSYDAALYQVRDGKITTIRRLRGGEHIIKTH